MFCREAVERTVAELGGLNVLASNAAYLQQQAGAGAADLRRLRPDLPDQSRECPIHTRNTRLPLLHLPTAGYAPTRSTRRRSSARVLGPAHTGR